jgi:soluble lytic murein transglycosylase
LEVGFRDWAEEELETARLSCMNSPEDLLELARIYDLYGMPWRSVRLYQKVKDSFNWTKRREFSREFRRLMYPIPYPIQVFENSARYDLPPHLVYAMIREESRFDLNAVSRVGALGLMQLMPATGRYVARELEIAEWGEEYLLEPEINLAFGVWYASSLMEVSENDPLRMLAAYNAGQGNAKRWFKKRHGDSSVIDTVDRIDFRETRAYVQRVVESANIYHSLYFDPGVVGSGPSR